MYQYRLYREGEQSNTQYQTRSFYLHNLIFLVFSLTTSSIYPKWGDMTQMKQCLAMLNPVPNSYRSSFNN